jgi:hypothetical protein
MPIMTAYRQRALACAAALAQGPRRSRDLKADIPDAPKILRSNVYGWFSPVERGVYTLAESGRSRNLGLIVASTAGPPRAVDQSKGETPYAPAALLRWPQPAPPTPIHQ